MAAQMTGVLSLVALGLCVCLLGRVVAEGDELRQLLGRVEALEQGVRLHLRGPPRASRGVRPIPTLRRRADLGDLLQSEGKKVGAEVGVRRGEFAQEILSRWPSCEKYHLVDIWREPPGGRAGEDSGRTENMNITRVALMQWEGKTVFHRMRSTEGAKEIPNDSLDWAYIDAQHDYCSVKADIAAYWPKMKSGGIISGHDYYESFEVVGEFWRRCPDGSIHPESVKGAVDDFFAKQLGLQVVVTYVEDRTWMVRKA